ncbi:MAG: DUF4160 domain-containing protein [Verrucomicrobiae bacterium]|nr:DUF4160 domain-containing protein [Verrucomicrobiae bacterium]
MPTVHFVLGWPYFFYSSERNEPMHIHARRGDAHCKFWLYPDRYAMEEGWSHNLTRRRKNSTASGIPARMYPCPTDYGHRSKSRQCCVSPGIAAHQ